MTIAPDSPAISGFSGRPPPSAIERKEASPGAAPVEHEKDTNTTGRNTALTYAAVDSEVGDHVCERDAERRHRDDADDDEHEQAPVARPADPEEQVPGDDHDADLQGSARVG